MKANVRHRKVSCPECGYTVRMARSWMSRGLPVCPCGESMEPVEAADLAWLGIIGPDDMGLAQWNAICRANGWDVVRNAGQAAQAARRPQKAARRLAPAAHCAYAGCGRWVADGAERCAAGHAQHEHVAAEAAMAF
jgi:hypothetical protein